MFIPDKIQLYELLPKDFYKENFPVHGAKLWMMFDNRLLLTLHEMRKEFGVVYLNNWYWGGPTQYRGWRPMDYDSTLSQHKFGRAADMKFKNASAEAVRFAILASPYSKAFKYISGLEMDVSWVHIDVGNRNRNTEFGGIEKFSK